MSICRTRSRQVVCLILTMVLALQAFTLFGNAKAQTEIDYYKQLMLLQQNAVKANEKLNQAFGCNERGEIQFPDDFAGVWIDGSNLVVSLVDISENNLEKYRGWAGEYADYLRFEKAEYPYKELLDAASEIVSDLENRNLNIHVSEYWISEKENEIVIGVDEVSCAIIEALPSLTECDYPISFEVTGDTVNTDIELKGADILYNETTNRQFSLSCCGTYNGLPALLTCGHVYQSVGNTIRYCSSLDTVGDVIGAVVYHQYKNYQNGDFEIVTISDPIFYGTNIIADEYKTCKIKGTLSDAAENTIVAYCGGRTGIIYYGIVDNRNLQKVGSTNSPIVVNGYSRIKVDGYYGQCSGGDSGGPVFMDRSDGGVNYCGVIGAKMEKEGNLYVYFTPWTYISVSGFYPKTY